MLKKIVIGITALIIIMSAMYCTHNYERANCKIINKCDGEITLQDKSGFCWYWYAKSANEWEFYNRIPIGNTVTLKMYDNGTANVMEDDIIKSISLN